MCKFINNYCLTCQQCAAISEICVANFDVILNKLNPDLQGDQILRNVLNIYFFNLPFPNIFKMFLNRYDRDFPRAPAPVVQ